MKKKTNSNLLKVVAAIVVVIVLLFLFRGNIYRMAVKYEDGGSRKSYDIKEGDLATFINQSLPNDEALDATISIEQIIDLSQEITTKVLDFSSDAQESDPQKLFVATEANYTGYAAFTSAVGTYLIKRFGMDKEWEAKPKKGKLYLFGNNMTKDAKSGWFKDHDFVVFRNKNTKEEIYVDPTVDEYLGLKRVDRYQK